MRFVKSTTKCTTKNKTQKKENEQMNELYSNIVAEAHRQYLKTRGEYPFVNFHVAVFCDQDENLHTDLNDYREDQILYLFIQDLKVKSVKIETESCVMTSKPDEIHTMTFVVTIEYYNT